jgi:hypothetical protein
VLVLFVLAVAGFGGYVAYLFLGQENAEAEREAGGRVAQTTDNVSPPREPAGDASPAPREPQHPEPLPEPDRETPRQPPIVEEEEPAPPRSEPRTPPPEDVLPPPTLITRDEDHRPPTEPPPPPPPKPSVVEAPRPEPDPEPERGGIVVKRRRNFSDEDLRKQLLLMPEVGFDQAAASVLYAPLQKLSIAKQPGAPVPADYGPQFLAHLAKQQRRPDLTSLPWRKGVDCMLGKEAADRLHVLSLNLRSCLQASTPVGDVRPDADRLRDLLTSGRPSGGRLLVHTAGEINPAEWNQPGAVPTLLQLLQHENTPIRLLLVERLAQIDGPEASAALAQRALFDLAPAVREQAIRALSRRPPAEYRPVLLDGLRYPWSSAADHAAEALVALNQREAVPALIHLLKEPDPRVPFTVKVNNKDTLMVREVVRLNHMSNCLLCHAPSLSQDDLVRGRIPIPGEDPPPLYYAERTGLFVRADITYLKQDFSVVQPVPNSGKWPGNQRYDYLVRTRPLTTAERTAFGKLQKDKEPPALSEQHEAVLFALRELTGKNLGSTYEEWKPLLQTAAPAEPPRPVPQQIDP